MPKQTYRVVIPYEEPTYQVHSKTDGAPYVATYSVAAESPGAAVTAALERFEGDAQDSGVGWIREPIASRIEVRVESRGAE